MKMLGAGSKIFGCRIGQVAINAIISLLLARSLAPLGMGHYSLTLAVVMFMAAVLNGGMGLAAVPPLRSRRVTLSRMLGAQSFWIAGIASLLVVVALFTGSPAISDLTSHRLGWGPVTGTWTVMAVLGLIAFDIFFYNLLAVGRLVVGPGVNFARAVLHLAVVGILLLVDRLDLTSAVFALALAQLAAVTTVALLLRRHGRRQAGGDELATPPAAADRDGTTPADGAVPTGIGRLIGYTLRRGWLGQFSAVASLLHLRLDLALVAAYCGGATVGIYWIAVLVGEMLWRLPEALSPLLIYSSADTTNPASRDESAARAVRVGLAATVAAAVPLALLAGPLLVAVFGWQYAASAPALRALLPGIVAFAPAAVLAGDFIGRGKPVWNAQASLLTVLVNVGCGVLLIPRYGAVGASVASSVAYFVGAVAMVARFRNVTGFSIAKILLFKPRDLRT